MSCFKTRDIKVEESDILTRSTSEFSDIDIAENHGGKSTEAIENINKQVRSSTTPKLQKISENDIFVKTYM